LPAALRRADATAAGQTRGERLASGTGHHHICGMNEPHCPLCGRLLGTINVDRHHLVPKSFKGKEQFLVHKICHRKIHSVFTERQLAQSFHSWDALQADPDIRAFIDWVARKPPAFYTSTATSERKKAR
jgi:5-methylcytosine-specific restriction endonuclease McrA